MPNIIVYGGGPQAVAAAAKAARNAPGSTVYVIVPDTSGKLGSIATVGGMNYWDTCSKPDGTMPQGGTFAYWFSLYEQFYNTDTMANQFLTNMQTIPNIVLKLGYDIYDIQMATNPDRLTQIAIRSIYRGSDGLIRWGSDTPQWIQGHVFIDASEDGRLTRLANFGGTVGRFDWPTSYLPSDEQSGLPRQQVATLMFKVTGVQPGVAGPYNDMFWRYSPKGVWGCWGGRIEVYGDSNYAPNPVIRNFNNTYGPQGYAFKGLNAAQNGPNSSEWWVNCFLVMNVDARAWSRDRNTWRYPTDKRPDYKDQDQAWADTRNFLKTHASEFLNALRQYPGFANANFVYDAQGYPVVGEVMYVRESIHMAINSGQRFHGTENSNYRLTKDMVAVDGADSVNYNHRIGVCGYWMDFNGYMWGDNKVMNGTSIRPDIPNNIRIVYVPYEVLITNYCANLLIPGYATGASSAAWSMLRVFPNLCVLGDAAGIAAAYCANYVLPSVYYGDYEIGNIQNMLRNIGAKLEK